ncbi:MAG TPA: MFS transporter [Planctomycetota bacterium]|nr:MFS transporter [Planctomycetota bacterium]
MPAAERLLIAILTAIQVLHLTDFVIMMPLGPQLMRVFAITPAQFGFMVSSYTFSAAIAGLVSALVIDRFDRKRALLTMFAGFVLANLACVAATDYLMLTGARILAGGFGGVLGALLFAIIGDYVAPERRGQATGILMAGFSIASVLGVPAGLWLAAEWSWHAPFLLLAGLGLVVWIVAALGLSRMRLHLERGAPHRPLATLLEVLREPNHWRAYVLMIALMFAGFSVIPFVSPFLVANVGLTEHHLALVYLIGGVCTVVTSPLIGRLVDRIGAVPVFLFAAGLSVVPIIALTNLPPLGELSILLITTVFIVFVSGRFVPAMTLITGSTEPHLRNAFMSVNSSIQSLAAGAAATVAGLIVTRPEPAGPLLHYNVVGFVAVGATIIAMFLAPRVAKRG